MGRIATPVALLALLLAGCQENTIGTRNSIPTVTITSHLDGDTVVEGFPFLVRASGGDADNAMEDLQATWYAANNLIPECNKIPLDQDGVTECEAVLFTQSEPKRVQVEVRDPRGGVGTHQVDLEVVPENAGYFAPTAEILAPVDGELLRGEQATAFEGRVSDLQDAPTDLAVEWTSSLDGVLSTAGADSAGTTQFVQPTLSSGVHTITLKVTDTEGNFTSDVITVTVNLAPSAPVVSISPDPPSSSQDLQASIDVESTDPEGDPIYYTYEWLRDGIVQPGLTSALVTADNTSRGETWTVRVYPNESGGLPGPFGEDSVVVENALPVVTSAVIDPDPAYTDTVISVTATTDDADGDTVNLAYDWQVNGVSIGQNGTTLDGLVHFDKGDLVQVWVTPNDGSTDGAPLGSNVLTIQNSPPTQPVVSIAPTAPTEQVDDLICSIDTYATDPDPGDTVSYAFTWDVDGVAYPRAGDVGPFQTAWPDDSASAADTLDGEEWTCSVTATDSDGLAGLPGQDMVTIGGAVLIPNYNGTFDIVPDIQYSCAGGAVNLNVTQLTFSEAGGILSVSGAPVVMTQNPAPAYENFSASGTIFGGCDETYTISGSFQDNDHFIGTFNLSFNGWQCSLTNCVNQVWPVDGYRL